MEVVGTGYEFAHKDDYQRTYPQFGDATLIYDDPTEYELEQFAQRIRPDLMGAGVKEKYAFHKMGLPFRQMHSWDYSARTTGGRFRVCSQGTWTSRSTTRPGTCSRPPGPLRGASRDRNHLNPVAGP